MIFRAIVLAAAVVVGAGAAHAQTPLDANDPAVTAKPILDVGKVRPLTYPAASRRSREEGETTITLCVSAAGVNSSAKVSKSSGYPRLDEATLNWVSNGLRFKPARAGDKAVDVCNYSFTYVWFLGATPKELDFREYSRISEQDRPLLLTRASEPPYPSTSLANGVSGTVKVELCIGPDGKVAALFKTPTGGDDALVKATLAMALASTYSPGKDRGRPFEICGMPFEHTWMLPH
jgi:TonB family protein